MSESTRPVGRPRSEDARIAVLRAVDGMLVDTGYAAMTMKGIAERAKVGRQTLYRWWSSKAEILLEACVADARSELTVEPRESAEEEIADFLVALDVFLSTSDAGLAYRALVGEAQHDRVVADLVRDADVLGRAAHTLIDSLRERGMLRREAPVDVLVGELIGPVFYRSLQPSGDAGASDPHSAARRILAP